MGKAPKRNWEEATLNQLAQEGKGAKYDIVKADALKQASVGHAYAAPARGYWRVVAGAVEEGKFRVPAKKGTAARRVGTPTR